jgi:RNA polymerase sigma factor (sigma-70 family)
MRDEPTTQGFVDALKAGDADAWKRVNDFYVPRLLQFVRQKFHVLPTEDHEDIVQESFQKVVKTFAKQYTYKGPGTFRAFLRRVAENTALSLCRKHRPQFEPLDENDSIEEIDAEEHEREGILDLLLMLRGSDPQGYEFLYDAEANGLSYQELAGKYQLSINSVGAKLTRLRSHFRELLTSHKDEMSI